LTEDIEELVGNRGCVWSIDLLEDEQLLDTIYEAKANDIRRPQAGA